MDSWIRMLKLRFKALFSPGRKESEMEREVRFHLENEIEENIRLGMSPEEARNEAIKEFGGMDKYKEACRDSWGLLVVRNFLRNARFGMRLSLRYRSSSVLAIIVLALGIALSVMLYTGFSRVIAIAVSGGLGFDERHLALSWETGKRRGERINSQDFKVFREELDSFDELVGIQVSGAWFHLPGKRTEGRQYSGAMVTPNLFEFTSRKPQLGRVFSKNDADFEGKREVVISDVIWEEFFDREEGVVDSTIMVNDLEYQIVGIMPAGFAFPQSQQFWLATDWREFDGAKRDRSPKLSVIGLLKPERSKDQASVELNAIAGNLAMAFPDTNEKYLRVRAFSYWDAVESMGGVIVILMGLGLSALVLMLACSNAFNILIARTAGRSHELATRCSLGAKRSHIMWQVMVDGLALAGMGAVFGLGLAGAGLRLISEYLKTFSSLSIFHDLRLEPNVILFSAGAAVFSGIGASMIPAWRASKIDAFGVLKDDAKSSSSVYIGWLSKAIVVSQVAFSAVVLFFGLVFLVLVPKQWAKTLDLPYDEKSVLTATVSLGKDNQFKGRKPEDLVQFYTRLKERLLSVPGVRSSALTSAEWGLMSDGNKIRIEGREDDDLPAAHINRVSPDFLEVYDAQPLSGRMINILDTHDNNLVCVVDANFAEVFFNGANPIGERLKLLPYQKPASEWITIVGVIPDLMPPLPGAEVRSHLMVPYTQFPAWSPTILLSADNAGDRQYRQAIRHAVNTLAPGAEIIRGIYTVEERLEILFRMIGNALRVGGVVGGAVLAMSLIGLYSIIAFTTSQRHKEFGIRMAIGSSPMGIVKTVTKPWFLTVGSGLVIGYLSLLGLLALLITVNGSDPSAGEVFDVSKDMGITYLWVVGLVCLCSLIGIGIPTWGATRVDPMDVIRAE